MLNAGVLVSPPGSGSGILNLGGGSVAGAGSGLLNLGGSGAASGAGLSSHGTRGGITVFDVDDAQRVDPAAQTAINAAGTGHSARMGRGVGDCFLRVVIWIQ